MKKQKPRLRQRTAKVSTRSPEEVEREKQAREYLRRMKRGTPHYQSKEAGRQIFRAYLAAQDLPFQLAVARQGDKDALALLREYARGARRTGFLKVPTDFHAFVWEWFIDGPPKEDPGQKEPDTLTRNNLLVCLVKAVSEHWGFPVYRNSKDRNVTAGEGAPVSACSLVAEVFCLSERRVEQIWAEHFESPKSIGGRSTGTTSAE
jgi:hypothetical protein